jgi:hypothetical protein
MWPSVINSSTARRNGAFKGHVQVSCKLPVHVSEDLGKTNGSLYVHLPWLMWNGDNRVYPQWRRDRQDSGRQSRPIRCS